MGTKAPIADHLLGLMQCLSYHKRMRDVAVSQRNLARVLGNSKQEQDRQCDIEMHERFITAIEGMTS